MSQPHPRHIGFESIPNFRDLGGYRTQDGRTVAWRRLFPSAALNTMNERDVAGLEHEIGLRDLRSPKSPERDPETVLLKELGARHYPIPFRPDSSVYVNAEWKAHANATHIGEIYLIRISEEPYGMRLVDALEIIAERSNHPLVFHCSAGKDRTGVLAAMILAAMGVVDEDVVEDRPNAGALS